MKSKYGGMMDLAIVDELKVMLLNSPKTHAMWIAGSVADGYADELSDIDLWVDIDDDTDNEIFYMTEAFLKSKGDLDVQLGRSLEKPFTHRVFHFKNMNPYHFIEFTLHTHSHEYDPNVGERKIIVLFDKDRTLDKPKRVVDKTTEENERQARKQSLIDKILVGYISVEKEIIRGQFMDAMHNYEFWLVTPMIELIRIKHSPNKTSFGLKHGSRDLPKEATDDIQSLYTIKSLQDFRNKIEDIKKLVNKYS